MPVTDFGAGADTSRFQLYYLAESAWGTTPAAALTEFRMTGESLSVNESSTQSNEIRSDRQVTDLVRTGFDPSGDVNFELSYGAFDPFFQASYFGTFTADYAVGPIAVTIANGDGTNDSEITDDGTTSALGAGTIAAGMYIKISGLTTNADENGVYHVDSVDSVDGITVSPRITAVSAEAGVSFANDGMLRNGTTGHSFTLEKKFTDVTEFFSFTGMMVNTASFDFSSESMLTGTFNFMGKNGVSATTTVGTGAAVAAPTNRVTNAVTNLGSIKEAGAGIGTEATYFLQSMSMQINNALRGQKAIGSVGNVGIGVGRSAITGSITVYFTSGALYRKWAAETETSLSWNITDVDGNTYVFSLPRVKLTNGQVVAGAIDQDVLATFDFQALRHTTLGYTAQLDRLDA